MTGAAPTAEQTRLDGGSGGDAHQEVEGRPPPLVEADSVDVRYRLRKLKLFGPDRYVHAVNNVSLSIARHTTLGLVGESGSGKSTLGRVLADLRTPSRGTVRFKGEPLSAATRGEWIGRRREIQMIFQDAAGALNPRLTIGAQLREILDVHRIGERSARRDRCAELLESVELNANILRRYSNQLSGGQRQRVVIARALALEPEFIVCDEPVSAVDVSVQAQILGLLAEQQAARELTYLFITHDLNVVRHVSDRVAVMYLGQIVEVAPTEALAQRQYHPYTQGLVAAIPNPDPRHRRRRRALMEGDPPSPFGLPAGCPFEPRCPHATEECRSDRPRLRAVAESHLVACHHAEEVAAST